jgi:hypothetical protein
LEALTPYPAWFTRMKAAALGPVVAGTETVGPEAPELLGVGETAGEPVHAIATIARPSASTRMCRFRRMVAILPLAAARARLLHAGPLSR